MKKDRRIQQFELVVYGILWVCVFLLTILFTYRDGVQWKRVYYEWIRLSPFLLVFLLNNFVLVPGLLFRKKYLLFALSVAGAAGGLVFLQRLIVPLDPLFLDVQRMMPDPPFRGAQHIFPRNNPLERGSFGMVKTFNQVVVALLIVGFNSGIKLFVRSIDDQRLQAEAQRQQLKTELAFLKYQISPHFFMNTLNNIHALVDIDRKDAKDAIIKLSGLMRYLLYDSEKEGKSGLKKEIDFIRNYLELMRLRYDDSKLDIRFDYPQELDDVRVPPLIFLSFIENAFKHGISYQGQAYVALQLELEGAWLRFAIKNKRAVAKEQRNEKSSGVGLENVKKRLELIYGGNFDLQIDKTESDFEVRLKLPTT